MPTLAFVFLLAWFHVATVARGAGVDSEHHSGISHHRQQPDADKQPVPQPASKSPETLKFKLVKISNGKSDDGTWWSKSDLIASDGHAIRKDNFPFSSTKRAQRQFDQYLALAQKIIRRNPEVNEQGKTVGERALCLFEGNATRKSQYILFWTSGAFFGEIAGEHLADVLALEERLRTNSLTEILKE